MALGSTKGSGLDCRLAATAAPMDEVFLFKPAVMAEDMVSV